MNFGDVFASKKRLILGAAIAPLSAPVLYVLFVMLFLPDHTPKQERTWEAALQMLAFFFIPTSYIISYFFGAPLIYILKRLKRLSFWPVLLISLPFGAAAIIGFLIVILMSSPVNYRDFKGWQDVAQSVSTGAIPGAILGLIIALTFCLISGITTRPDQATQREKKDSGIVPP